MAAFRGAGREADRRDTLLIMVIKGARVDIFVLTRVKGKGSRAHVVGFIFLTVSKISC